jgi:hypothetical protein
MRLTAVNEAAESIMLKPLTGKSDKQSDQVFEPKR